MAGEYGVNINFRVKGQSGLDRLNSKVKELSKRAVNVSMFVFGAQTEEQLVSMSDLDEGYHKVRHYIILPEDSFWQRSLPCDPDQPACEEF